MSWTIVNKCKITTTHKIMYSLSLLSFSLKEVHTFTSCAKGIGLKSIKTFFFSKHLHLQKKRKMKCRIFVYFVFFHSLLQLKSLLKYSTCKAVTLGTSKVFLSKFNWYSICQQEQTHIDNILVHVIIINTEMMSEDNIVLTESANNIICHMFTRD